MEMADRNQHHHRVVRSRVGKLGTGKGFVVRNIMGCEVGDGGSWRVWYGGVDGVYN